VDPVSVVAMINLQNQIEINAKEDVSWLVDLAEILEFLLRSAHQYKVELLLGLMHCFQEVNMDNPFHPQK